MSEQKFYICTPEYLTQLLTDIAFSERKIFILDVGGDFGWAAVYFSASEDDGYIPLTNRGKVRLYKTLDTLIGTFGLDEFPGDTVETVLSPKLRFDTPKLPFGKLKHQLFGLDQVRTRKPTTRVKSTKPVISSATSAPSNQLPATIPDHPKLTPERIEKIKVLEKLHPGAVRFAPDRAENEIPFVQIYNTYIPIDHPLDYILASKHIVLYGEGENRIQKAKAHFEASDLSINEYMDRLNKPAQTNKEVQRAEPKTETTVPKATPKTETAVPKATPKSAVVKDQRYYDQIHLPQADLLTIDQVITRNEKYNELCNELGYDPEQTEDYLLVIVDGKHVNLLDGYVAPEEEDDELC
jgi:hypothetical protein